MTISSNSFSIIDATFSFFIMTPPEVRETVESYGIRSGRYTAKDLKDLPDDYRSPAKPF